LDIKKENNMLKTKKEILETQLKTQEDSRVAEDKPKTELTTTLNLEHQGRMNGVRIYGVDDRNAKESVDECIKKIVTEMKEKPNIPFSEHAIDVAHRKGNYNGQRPRPVICKLVHR